MKCLHLTICPFWFYSYDCIHFYRSCTSGVDLDTWEARFKNLSAQSRDILLVYLQVNFAKHVHCMREIGSMEEKMKRDAEVKDVLHLYIQTFVCLSVVFPSVFANADYSMAVLDSLQEIDILMLKVAFCVKMLTLLF